MSKIAYDPIKDRFAGIIRTSRPLRTLFYKLLDLFFLRSWHVRKVIRKIGRPLDEAGSWRMLDAGSGFGQYDRFILHDFFNVRVKAFDVKGDYLDACRYYFKKQIAEGRISFHVQDLLEAELEPEFDLAICVDVLEHIEDDVRVMANIADGLKEGGFFLMHSPSHLAEEDAGEDEFFVDEHARAGYSKEDISSKLRKAGLEPVEVQYTYGKYGHAAWVMLIKNPMLWLTNYGFWALPLIALYYLPTLPVGLLLMAADVMRTNERGTGIYALARKQ